MLKDRADCGKRPSEVSLGHSILSPTAERFSGCCLWLNGPFYQELPWTLMEQWEEGRKEGRKKEKKGRKDGPVTIPGGSRRQPRPCGTVALLRGKDCPEMFWKSFPSSSWFSFSPKRAGSTSRKSGWSLDLLDTCIYRLI